MNNDNIFEVAINDLKNLIKLMEQEYQKELTSGKKIFLLKRDKKIMINNYLNLFNIIIEHLNYIEYNLIIFSIYIDDTFFKIIDYENIKMIYQSIKKNLDTLNQITGNISNEINEGVFPYKNDYLLALNEIMSCLELFKASPFLSKVSPKKKLEKTDINIDFDEYKTIKEYDSLKTILVDSLNKDYAYEDYEHLCVLYLKMKQLEIKERNIEKLDESLKNNDCEVILRNLSNQELLSLFSKQQLLKTREYLLEQLKDQVNLSYAESLLRLEKQIINRK